MNGNRKHLFWTKISKSQSQNSWNLGHIQVLTKVGAQFTGWLSNTGTTRFTEPRLGRTWRHCRWYAGSILNSVTPCKLFREKRRRNIGGIMLNSLMNHESKKFLTLFCLLSSMWFELHREKKVYIFPSVIYFLYFFFFSINCYYWNWLFCKHNVDIKEWIFLDYI